MCGEEHRLARLREMVIFRLFQYQKSEKKDLSSHNLASLCSSLCNKSPKSWFSLPHPHILDFTILLIGLFIVGPGRFISGARYDDLFEGRETFNIEFLSTTGLSLSLPQPLIHSIQTREEFGEEGRRAARKKAASHWQCQRLRRGRRIKSSCGRLSCSRPHEK